MCMDLQSSDRNKMRAWYKTKQCTVPIYLPSLRRLSMINVVLNCANSFNFDSKLMKYNHSCPQIMEEETEMLAVK